MVHSGRAACGAGAADARRAGGPAADARPGAAVSPRGLRGAAVRFPGGRRAPGRGITFGYLEAQDARAAFDELRRRAPGERVGVLGQSLGGAAAVLSDPPLEADAMVLEAVYASFATAVENRIAMSPRRRGPLLAPVLTPLDLAGAAAPRIFVRCPAAGTACPRFAHAAARDRRRRRPARDAGRDELIYANANAPKEFWVIAGARHQDFYSLAETEYERRVVGFLKARLRG